MNIICFYILGWSNKSSELSTERQNSRERAPRDRRNSKHKSQSCRDRFGIIREQSMWLKHMKQAESEVRMEKEVGATSQAKIRSVNTSSRVGMKIDLHFKGIIFALYGVER